MISKPKRLYFRNELRLARAETLRDSENYFQILFVLERLGILLHGPNGSLKQYESDLRKVAERSELLHFYNDYFGTTFEQLFNILREARNESMHVGAFARHAANTCVLVASILEDGLMNGAERLSEFMVSEPVIAEMWQPIGIIRQKMLANSFSFLPVAKAQGQWALVADSSLAQYLRCIGSNERKRRLARPIEDVVDSGGIELQTAICCRADIMVADVKDKIDQRPILLFKDEERKRLLGLITAFDLL